MPEFDTPSVPPLGEPETFTEIDLIGSASGSIVLTSKVTGDTQKRFTGAADGTHSWGPGTGAVDVTFSRTSAGVLGVGGNLSVSGLTPGQVVFPGAAGLLQGSSSFFWDNANLIASTKGAVSPGGIDLRARTAAADGMPNSGDAAVIGDGWMRIYGHGTNEFMDLSYYKFGSTITVRNLRGSGGAECALEIHGWNGSQTTAICTFVRAVSATPDYCDIQVRNPTDTDGLWLGMYASEAGAYPITATSFKLGCAFTAYAEFQTNALNLRSTTVLGFLNGTIPNGAATTATVDCSIARNGVGLLNINGGSDPGSVTKGMTMIQSAINGTVGWYIQNTDNTNGGSHSLIWLQNGGNSGGNAYMRFTSQSVIDWTFGLKRTTNNIHFSVSNALGTSDALQITFHNSLVLNNAAVATNATDGFLYIATCAGTPTGVPTSFTGRVPIVFDTTGVKIWVYTGGAWKGVVVA